MGAVHNKCPPYWGSIIMTMVNATIILSVFGIGLSIYRGIKAKRRGDDAGVRKSLLLLVICIAALIIVTRPGLH
jgi:hypothetical protein